MGNNQTIAGPNWSSPPMLKPLNMKRIKAPNGKGTFMEWYTRKTKEMADTLFDAEMLTIEEHKRIVDKMYKAELLAKVSKHG